MNTDPQFNCLLATWTIICGSVCVVQWCCHGWRAIPPWPPRPLRRPRRWEAGAAPPPLLHQAERGTLTLQLPIQRQVSVPNRHLLTVLQIHDIFVWIRIRIQRSMHLDPDSDTDQGANKKEFFLWSFSAYYFLKIRPFTSFFKDKKLKRSHKTLGIKVFLTIFAWW